MKKTSILTSFVSSSRKSEKIQAHRWCISSELGNEDGHLGHMRSNPAVESKFGSSSEVWTSVPEGRLIGWLEDAKLAGES